MLEVSLGGLTTRPSFDRIPRARFPLFKITSMPIPPATNRCFLICDNILCSECYKYHIWSVRLCLITSPLPARIVNNSRTRQQQQWALRPPQRKPPQNLEADEGRSSPLKCARVSANSAASGGPTKKIQEKHPTIPSSTIVSTCRREHDRVDQKSKPRSGPPKKITEEDRDRMAEILKLDPNITWKDLSKECEKAGVTTVRKLMSEVRRR